MQAIKKNGSRDENSLWQALDAHLLNEVAVQLLDQGGTDGDVSFNGQRKTITVWAIAFDKKSPLIRLSGTGPPNVTARQ
ncbi:hypothetical protein V8E36_001058 [Tilletia maclaganii]